MMFRPRDSYDQRLIEANLVVSPDPASVTWVHDVFGNCITNVGFDTPSADLRFETNILLDHTPQLAPQFLIDPTAKIWPLEYDAEILPDLAPYLTVQHPSAELEKWARQFTRSGLETETGHLLMTMTMGIRESFHYSRRTDPGTQPPEFTLAHRKGTCRDFAWLMIEACRSLGFAARFVTGYIYVPSRDVKSVRGSSSTHAWVQVFLPGAGWIEFDPTNGIVGSKDLIRVGVARRPKQAMPLSGNFIGSRADYLGMTVEVLVSDEGSTAAGHSIARQPSERHAPEDQMRDRGSADDTTP